MIGDRARARLRDHWAAPRAGWRGGALDAALAGVEAPYRLATGLRNAWHDVRPARRAPLPVVSVGNLAVGGTGKTPVVRWLADWLGARGVDVGVALRGYGADEVELLRRWLGRRRVFVDPDRAAGARAAAERGCAAALLDDGFQHRRLARALDVLLVAAEDPFPVRLLPRGPYREPLAAARRATHALVTRRAAPPAAAAAWARRLERAAPGAPVQEIEMRMVGWSDVQGARIEAPRGDVLAVCGIARPDAFATGLARMLPGAEIELAAYPDHHAFTAADAKEILARRRGRPIVCTAKDAVKLGRHPRLAKRSAVVDLEVAGEPSGALASDLLLAVGL